MKRFLGQDFHGFLLLALSLLALVLEGLRWMEHNGDAAPKQLSSPFRASFSCRGPSILVLVPSRFSGLWSA